MAEARDRCGGKGWYMYDHNHGTGCPDCCQHERTYIQSDGHPEPGALTCSHCGTVLEAEREKET